MPRRYKPGSAGTPLCASIHARQRTAEGVFLLRLFLKNFLMIGILTAAAFGLLWPSPGAVLADANLLPVLIVVIFVCSGLLLQPGSLKCQLRNGRAIGFALLAINIIFPLVALLIARIFNITGDAFIGLLVVAAAPPTLASGIIITTLAGGATALAILLTILGSLSAVVIMPFSLRIVLSLTTEIDLPVLRIFSTWVRRITRGWPLPSTTPTALAINCAVSIRLVTRTRSHRTTLPSAQTGVPVLSNTLICPAPLSVSPSARSSSGTVLMITLGFLPLSTTEIWRDSKSRMTDCSTIAWLHLT